MFVVVLLLLLVVAPLAELFVIFQVADVLGGWQTLGLLVVESAVGAWLLKRQGLSTMGKISAALGSGRMPGPELVDGFLILVAGALMLAPGFVGDVIGYLLLIPPTRALVRGPLQRRFEAGKHGRLFTMAGSGGGRFVRPFRAGPTGAGSVFEASGHEAGPPNRGRLEP